MLRGRYGANTGRPYVEGRLAIPRLGLSGEISFLMDTGADRSAVMPLDARRLGLDYGRLGSTVPITGVGGVSVDFVEPALLAFVGTDLTIHVYSVDIHFPPVTSYNGEIPSLLGRDVMNCWAIRFDPLNRILEASVHYSDHRFPPPRSG